MDKARKQRLVFIAWTDSRGLGADIQDVEADAQGVEAIATVSTLSSTPSPQKFFSVQTRELT